MKDYLKKYNVELEVVGPVFIGSGKELNKKEYILRQNEIWIMDIPKLYEYMKKKGMTAQFESFFLDERRKDLYGFLRENGIRPDEVISCVKYREMQSDTSLERGNQISVMEFVKDSYGLPYIPGSSIKGMLRTILLSREIAFNGAQFVEAKSNFRQSLGQRARRNTYLRSEQKYIEAVAFNKLKRNDKKKQDAVNDILSGLRVSDSMPLEIKDLVLCQRSEYHVDGTEKNLNVLRECIKPGVSIRFTITIDETICHYTKEDIIQAINYFNDNYNAAFRTKYHRINKGSENTVYLGGGVGFVSKTTIYPLFGDDMAVNIVADIFENTNVPREHKHNKDRQLGVSPHILKTTHYEGKLCQMGECLWKFT